MPSRKLDDDERDRIAAALRDGRSVRDVADEFGRGRSTVSRVAAEKGVLLDGSLTAAATNRRMADHRTRVLAEAEAALSDATKLRGMWFGAGVLHNWFKGEHNSSRVDSLPAGEIKSLAIAWGIAVQRSIELQEFGDLLERIEELERKAADAGEERPR